jgi:HD-like signal output (HDOD) protein/ActR/RegA family two-component response regulator
VAIRGSGIDEFTGLRLTTVLARTCILMKKRILFVEDDPLLLQMYTMMMEDERDRWEVVVAADALQALQEIERGTFDVVVADLILPGMDGSELMNEIRARCPDASRIIISVISDQERVARCLEMTHQFITKPFDVRVLKTTLHRVCSLDTYLKSAKLKALVGRLGKLPSFPTLYMEVNKELASPNSSIENIAEIVAQDPAMTAKMLQIVNSVALGLARRISSPFEAVEFLGLGTVRSLVLSAHIFTSFERNGLKDFSVDRLWRHAIQTGMAARMIMQLENADAADAEEAYIAGMLHDIGKLILANSQPEQFERALALAAERKSPLWKAEEEVFGASHAGAAAYLLGLWGLPVAIVEAVAFHHTPRMSNLRTLGPLTAVHAANVLEQELAGSESTARAAQLDMDYLAVLGVHDHVKAWRTEAVKVLNSRKEQ